MALNLISGCSPAWLRKSSTLNAKKKKKKPVFELPEEQARRSKVEWPGRGGGGRIVILMGRDRRCKLPASAALEDRWWACALAPSRGAGGD